METKPLGVPALRVRIQGKQKDFEKVRDAKGNVTGVGHFYLQLEVAALAGTVYVPLSVASGKKPTGFIYQIEGTGESSIVTTAIALHEAKKSGVSQILLGTISYAAIPEGMTATFYMTIDMRGQIGKEYTIVITSLQYKKSPSDARYQKHIEEIRTDTLKFRS